MLSSFEMVWKMTQNIPSSSGWAARLPMMIREWFQKDDVSDENEARKHLLLNCVYDLVQDAKLISEFLKLTDNCTVEEKNQMETCLKKCLNALLQEDVQNALEEFLQQPQVRLQLSSVGHIFISCSILSVVRKYRDARSK